jgi:hypothetical protein
MLEIFVYNYKWILSIYSLLSYLPTSFELNSCENLARGQGHGRGSRMETPSPDRKRFFIGNTSKNQLKVVPYTSSKI